MVTRHGPRAEGLHSVKPKGEVGDSPARRSSWGSCGRCLLTFAASDINQSRLVVVGRVMSSCHADAPWEAAK